VQYVSNVYKYYIAYSLALDRIEEAKKHARKESWRPDGRIG
jgi:hypothetical protein